MLLFGHDHDMEERKLPGYGIETPVPLKVKDTDLEERPREKARKYGIGSLTNAECLAIVLRSGTPGNPITKVCRDLMKCCGNSFLELERMTDDQLLGFPGVGAVKVQELRTILEIMRRYHVETRGDRPKIGSSRDIYGYFKYVNANKAREEMWALFLDNGHSVLREMKVSEGSAVGTVADIKRVLKEGLLCNAECVVLCHNHPSGTLRPSAQDDQVTRRLADACRTMDMRLLDHIVISTEGYYSYSDEGRLWKG